MLAKAFKTEKEKKAHKLSLVLYHEYINAIQREEPAGDSDLGRDQLIIIARKTANTIGLLDLKEPVLRTRTEVYNRVLALLELEEDFVLERTCP